MLGALSDVTELMARVRLQASNRRDVISVLIELMLGALSDVPRAVGIHNVGCYVISAVAEFMVRVLQLPRASLILAIILWWCNTEGVSSTTTLRWCNNLSTTTT
jgi:hypothetical protein